MKRLYLFLYIGLLPFAILQYAILAVVEEYVIDMAGRNDISYDKLLRAAIYTFLLLVVIFIAQWIVKVCKYSIIQEKIRSIRHDVFTKLLYNNIQTIKEQRSSFTSLLMNDVRILENEYYPTLFLIIEQSLKLMIGVYMIVCRNAVLGICLIIGFCLPMFIPKLFQHLLKETVQTYSTAYENYTEHVDETWKGIEVIKNYKVEHVRKKEDKQRISEIKTVGLKLAVYKETSNSLIWGLSCLTMVIGLFYGAYLVSIGELTMGEVIAILQLANGVSEPIVNIAGSLNTIQAAIPMMKKVKPYRIKRGEEKTHTITWNNTLELQDVSFKIQENEILKHIRLTIHKGDKILILGRNGSGKSSLLKILSKEWNPSTGYVSVDGKILEHHQCIANIGIVSQNIFIFHDSLEHNITLYEPFEPQIINQIINEFELQEVYQTKGKEKLGKDGSTLSGGQKQKIELARAWIRNCDLLLLDEACSAIDNESAKRLEEKLLASDKTIISVAHHLYKETLFQYTTILVMQDGQIIEQGTPQALQQNPKAYLHALMQEK